MRPDPYTAELPLVDRQHDDALYAAYRAADLRRHGYRYEDALRSPALGVCLRNLARAMTERRVTC